MIKKISLTLTASIIVMLGCATTSMAQNIWIEYGYSCAEWSQARSEEYYFNRGRAEGTLVGILNGFALASGNDFWRSGAGLKPEQAFFWMDRFCNNNPLNAVTIGAAELMVERFGKGWVLR